MNSGAVKRATVRAWTLTDSYSTLEMLNIFPAFPEFSYICEISLQKEGMAALKKDAC